MVEQELLEGGGHVRERIRRRLTSIGTLVTAGCTAPQLIEALSDKNKGIASSDAEIANLFFSFQPK